MVAYFERRGQDCLLQSPVTLYSFRQKLWVFALVLDIFMKRESILYFERAKVMVDDVPDQLVRVHVVDEDSGVSKEIFLLPNFTEKKIYVVEITCKPPGSRRNQPNIYQDEQGQVPRHVHSRQTNKRNTGLSFQPRPKRSYRTQNTMAESYGDKSSSPAATNGTSTDTNGTSKNPNFQISVPTTSTVSFPFPLILTS
jgi:hypothetical protein